MITLKVGINDNYDLYNRRYTKACITRIIQQGWCNTRSDLYNRCDTYRSSSNNSTYDSRYDLYNSGYKRYNGMYNIYIYIYI